MAYIYGVLLSLLIGLSNSVTRGLATKIPTKYCVLISSWFNLSGSLLVYFIVYHKSNTQYIDWGKVGLVQIGVLVLYLAFRIFSNVSQTKLMGHKHININILNIVLSCMFFVTIGIDALTGTSYGFITLVGFILSLVGILTITVDFKNLGFYFTKQECFLLLVSFICAGTKPVMAKYLMNYIPLALFGVMECLNYVIIYTIYNCKSINKITGLNKEVMKQFILQSVISVCCIFLQLNAVSDVKVYVLTSFTTPIFTAIFAYLIHKQLINRKTAIGIVIILLGICVSKLNM
jgi:EamA-like transporter family.